MQIKRDGSPVRREDRPLDRLLVRGTKRRIFLAGRGVPDAQSVMLDGCHHQLAIGLREDPDTVAQKLRTMQTDPARVHRSDTGTPEKCPVWSLHKIYSDEETKSWAHKGCTTAGIGCLECKQPIIDAIIAEQEPIKERAQQFLDDPSLVRAIVAEGCERARKLSEETMRDVREAMGLAYT